MEIKKELVISASVSRVYDAITDMNQLSQWFPDIISLEPKINGKIVFKFASNSSDVPDTIEGKITELEKNKKLAYTWSHPDVPNFPITKVSWNLKQIDKNKTRVMIIHSGFVDEETMNSYNKKWFWITEHLDAFTVSKKPVSMREQVASGLIPGVDIWAFYRIKKLQKSTLYITVPSIIVTIIFTIMTFSNYDSLQVGIMNNEEYVQSQAIIGIEIIFFVVSIMILSNYLLRRWTKEWNQQFVETKKHRPIGIFILSAVYVLDAAVMIIFLGFYSGIPELQSFVSQTPDLLTFNDELAIVNFSDWVFELGTFVIIFDSLVVIGLLSAREKGRRLVISCIFVGITFNVVTFGMYGLVTNCILLWYLFRTKIKESFRITA